MWSEYRFAWDNNAYTIEGFVEYYGQAAEDLWEKAYCSRIFVNTAVHQGTEIWAPERRGTRR